MTRKALVLTLVASALAWGCGHSARASTQAGTPTGSATVLVSESVLLQESAGQTTSLSIPGPGELFVTLTDLQFPTSFSSLQYAVSNGVGAVVTPTAAGVTTTLDLTAPTTLYANVFATVGSSGVGLYNLTATFFGSGAPVPLPGTLGLLGSGGLLLVLMGRRRAWARPVAA